MISSLHNENNPITIPGFYDKVEEVSREERDEMAKRPFSLDDYKKALDIINFFFSGRRRHTRWTGDWSSDVCSSDLHRSWRNRRCHPPVCTSCRRRWS